MLHRNLENLQKLVDEKVIKLDDFYSIDIDDRRASLQGNITSGAFGRYKDLVGLEFLSENQWFEGQKDGIKIILTLGF